MKTNRLALLLAAAAFLALGGYVLTGCAVESPRLYAHIPHTPYSAYVYGGAGVAVDPDADTLAK